jgi:GT2 family glycosyltransferase
MPSTPGPSTPPSVAVVVLNWNGAQMTLDCIESLRETRAPALRIIVVDNASSDDSVARVRADAPDVELIVNGGNLGFAEGNNVGIRAALDGGASHVLILNNDTLVEPRAIQTMVDEADRIGDAGAVSPLICFAEPDDLIWFAGAQFDPRRGYPGRVTGYRERDRGQFSSTHRVDRLTGAAMLVKREAIERTGMFDGDLFFLYEDVDWSLRMRAAGYGLYLVPAAKILHRVAATQSGEHSPLSFYFGVRNQLVVSRRHASLGRARAAARDAAAIGVYVARLRHAARRGPAAVATAQGVADAARGRLGPWKPARRPGR